MRAELKREKEAHAQCAQDLEVTQRQLHERKDLEEYAATLLSANHKLTEELSETKELLNETVAGKTPHSHGSFDGISHIESEECINLLAELEQSASCNRDDDLNTTGSTSVPLTPSRQKDSPAEQRMKDPMYFHFHMLLQGIKVRMAMTEGDRHGFSIEYLNAVTTESMYDTLMSSVPPVPFFEWEQFIKDSVTREYVAQVYEKDIERRIEEGPLSETATQAKILLAKGLITEQEYTKIVNADKDFRVAELVSNSPLRYVRKRAAERAERETHTRSEANRDHGWRQKKISALRGFFYICVLHFNLKGYLLTPETTLCYLLFSL